MEGQPSEIPAGYSYPVTAGWFVAGAAVTAAFSGSLAALARNAGLAEVLVVGMLVPSFTWVVQMSASAIGFPSPSGISLCTLYYYSTISPAAAKILKDQ